MRLIAALLEGVVLIVTLCLLPAAVHGQVDAAVRAATATADSATTTATADSATAIADSATGTATADSATAIADSATGTATADSATAIADSISAAVGPLFAVIETDRGLIRLELHASRAPMTVANFVNLAERGFYDGLTFHRVHPGQFVQGGSPTGRSDGGPGYVVDNEFAGDLAHSAAGVVSMAGGPGGNGSQFFITLDARPFLDGMHTVFGRVVESQAVVDAIRSGDVMRRVRIEGEPTALHRRYRDSVAEWNAVLDGDEASGGE